VFCVIVLNVCTTNRSRKRGDKERMEEINGDEVECRGRKRKN